MGYALEVTLTCYILNFLLSLDPIISLIPC